MKISMLILSMLLVSQVSALAAPINPEVNRKYYVHEKTADALVDIYETVVFLGYGKNGEYFVQRDNGNITKIKVDQLIPYMDKKNCAEDFCAGQAVYVANDKENTSYYSGVITYIDKDAKKAFVTTPLGGSVDVVPLSALTTTLYSTNPPGSVIEGANFNKKDTLRVQVPAVDVAKTLITTDETTGK